MSESILLILNNLELIQVIVLIHRRGGGGDFVAGFVLGGVVFGALGYLLAPQVTKFWMPDSMIIVVCLKVHHSLKQMLSTSA